MERLLLFGDEASGAGAVRWLRVLLSHPHAPTRLVATRRATALLAAWQPAAGLALLRGLLEPAGLAAATLRLLEACHAAGEVRFLFFFL
jgi:hypothetical protein